MSSLDFLNKMREIGDEFGKQGGAEFITQIKLEFGFYAYAGPDIDRMRFWKRCEDMKEAGIIKAEVQADLDHAEIKEQPDFCLHIFANGNCLGRDPKGFDDNLFIAKWQWDTKQDGIETCASLIFASMEENKLPFGELFWGKYQLKSNPYHVNLGETGKKESKKEPGKFYWPTFVLPIYKFANEAEAQAAVGGDSQATNNGKWSATALANYSDPTQIESSTEEILKYLKNAEKGIPFNDDADSYPLPVPLTPPNVKKYIADIYLIEPSDINLLIPF